MPNQPTKRAVKRPSGAVKASPKLTKDPQMRAQAIDALAKLGVPKTEGAGHVDAVGGDKVEDVVANAFRRRQAIKEGRTPPPMATGPTMPSAAVPPPAPISQPQAPQLGLPPGGMQAAPSAQQLQAQGPVPRPEVSAVERLAPRPTGIPPINFGLLPQGPQRVPQPTPVATQQPVTPPEAQVQVPAAVQPATPPVAPISPIQPEGGGPRVGWRVKQPKEHPVIRTKDEWDKLKSGDHFIWTDGYLYRKD